MHNLRILLIEHFDTRLKENLSSMWGGLSDIAAGLAERGANLLAELDERIEDDDLGDEPEASSSLSKQGLIGVVDSSDDDEEEADKSVKSDLSSTSTDENNEGSLKFKDSHRPRNESPNSRKERKQTLKAETAEKRKSKIKKHVKKRKEKATTTKKK